MGTVTNTIGSAGGRDYSTIALWEASLPANMVTAGNNYVGQCFNDSEFVITSPIVISGHTTDATHFPTLTTGAGQGFKDNASVQTNALKYNVANGVGIKQSTAYQGVIDINDKFGVANGLQFSIQSSAFNASIRLQGTSAAIQNSIIQLGVDLAAHSIVMMGNNSNAPSCSLINCLVLDITTSGNTIRPIGIGNDGLMDIANCDIVRVSDNSNFGTTGVGLYTAAGGHYAGKNKVTNTAVFGYASFTDDVTNWNTSSTNNATDLAATTVPGSANQVSKTYASQFAGVTSSTADFKTKTGANLLDNGATDTTDIPGAIDIVGTTRPQGTAWDIGCWELVVSGGTTTYSLSVAEGTYALTGQPQALNSARKIAAAEGVFSITGEAIAPQVSMTAAQGSYGLTGEAQALLHGRMMAAVAGAYALTGEAIAPQVAAPAAQGAYGLTGKPQAFAVALSALLAEGVYGVAGSAAILTYTAFGSAGLQPHSLPFLTTVGPITAR